MNAMNNFTISGFVVNNAKYITLRNQASHASESHIEPQ